MRDILLDFDVVNVSLSGWSWFAHSSSDRVPPDSYINLKKYISINKYEIVKLSY